MLRKRRRNLQQLRRQENTAAEEEELIGIYRTHVRRRLREHEGDAEALVQEERAKYPRSARKWDKRQQRDRNEPGR